MKGNVFKKIKIDMHFIVWKYGEDVHTPQGEFRVDVVIRKSSQWRKKNSYLGKVKVIQERKSNL